MSCLSGPTEGTTSHRGSLPNLLTRTYVTYTRGVLQTLESRTVLAVNMDNAAMEVAPFIVLGV